MMRTSIRFLILICAKSLKTQFMQRDELSHINGLFLSVRPLYLRGLTINAGNQAILFSCSSRTEIRLALL